MPSFHSARVFCHLGSLSRLAKGWGMAVVLLAFAYLPSCSTVATTVGEYRTDNLVISGARHSVSSLVTFLQNSDQMEEEFHQVSAISVLEVVLIDLPFSFAADLVLLPVTVPYTLLHSGEKPEEEGMEASPAR